jgi:hypothetical protein
MSLSDEKSRPLEWNEKLEEWACDMGEKCMSYAWCHLRAEEIYSARETRLQFPIVIISSINSFFSAISNQIMPDDKNASIYVGIIGLLTALLSTIAGKLQYGRLAESHKSASVQYSKLQRLIHLEMATKPREDRMECNRFVDLIRTNYDQLYENSPALQPTIIELFTKRFENLKDFDRPEEINGLHPIYKYKDSRPHLTIRAPPNSPYPFSPRQRESRDDIPPPVPITIPIVPDESKDSIDKI